MIQKDQWRALLLAVLMIVSIGTVFSGSAVAAANPAISVAEAPDTVGQDDTFTIEYNIENTGEDQGAFSLEIPNLPPGITVETIEGDIQASDLDSDAPTASTDNAAAGGTLTVTVTYNTTNAEAGETALELTASQPLDGTSDSLTSTVTVQEPAAVPEIGVTSGDDTARQGNTYERVYTITNTGTDPGAFTLNVSNAEAGISIDDITGDIQSADVDATPPSATTNSVSAGGSVTVTVNYTVASDAATGMYAPFTLSAEQPLDNTNASDSGNITVKEPVSDDPKDRALEVSQKEDPSQITQNDITATITRFDRGQTSNGVDISQSDITTLITLFDRNR
jgi:uncharacterized membrane protein